MDDGVWIFGYGSLVWRPDFAYAESRPALIDGWARRFWQGSTDHRGVPGAPGRVVTLIEAPGEACWGMAYRIAGGDRDGVLAKLDYREKGGYRLAEVSIRFAGPDGGRADGPAPRRSDSGRVGGLVYVATEENPNYLGPAELADIAAQVRASRGPSGHNVEYVLRLADALKDLGAEDDHVFGIARLVGDPDRKGGREGRPEPLPPGKIPLFPDGK